MLTISSRPERHCIIDKRPGHYTRFPDIALAGNGDLLCVYSEADKHVHTRKKLLLSRSTDLGRTWSPPMILSANGGHCPRITLLPDGQLFVIDDGPRHAFWSLDHGHTWAGTPMNSLKHAIYDRVIVLDAERFLTTGHNHRGTVPFPDIGQAPTEQMVYLSTNRGRAFTQLCRLAHTTRLVLCEASMTRLTDGRILALLRENSGVFEPMYSCISENEGRTWSEPKATPLIGHRPCLGRTREGRLLVTYRNVGPDPGTCAWLGDIEELGYASTPGGESPEGTGFQVHGAHPCPDNPRLTQEGLLVENASGKGAAVSYALRPMTDALHARATLRAHVRVHEGEPNHCALRLGVWFRIGRDWLRPDIPGARALKLPSGRGNDLRLEYCQGEVTVYVNNRKRRSYPLRQEPLHSRAVLFGNADRVRENGGKSVWRELSLSISEPRELREYEWNWTPDKGVPDAWASGRILELKSGGGAHPADFGYSGWVESLEGGYLCVYHHAEAESPEYAPGLGSYVMFTRFGPADFTL